MSQATRNLEPIYAGEIAEITFVVPSDNVATWTCVFTVGQRGRPSLLSTNVVVLDAETLVVTLTSTQTASLGRGTFLYDLWRTDVGFEQLIAIGELPVLSSIRIQ